MLPYDGLWSSTNLLEFKFSSVRQCSLATWYWNITYLKAVIYYPGVKSHPFYGVVQFNFVSYLLWQPTWVFVRVPTCEDMLVHAWDTVWCGHVTRWERESRFPPKRRLTHCSCILVYCTIQRTRLAARLHGSVNRGDITTVCPSSRQWDPLNCMIGQSDVHRW